MQAEFFKLRIPMQIRFTDLDILGHVTNTVYHVYYNTAVFEYYRRVFIQNRMPGDLAFVLASAKVDFLKSILFEYQIAVEMRIARLGNKSFAFHGRIVDAQSGEVYSRCVLTQVCFSRSRDASIPIPDDWRARVLAFETTPPEQ